MAAPVPPLSQAVGYGVILGVGFLFALGMMLITYILKRYNSEVQTSEMFTTYVTPLFPFVHVRSYTPVHGYSHKRLLSALVAPSKSGLVASAVVSSWTWSATLLQSTSVAYRYGVSGPFWYASGATVQIILFATLAIELKRRAPNAHTFLEVIRARYGPVTHTVYIVFGLMTNILVTAMLLTGGSAVITSLTGVPTAAACFLLPIGVVLYTASGGIKATFVTDWVHTFMLLIIILVLAFTTYATSSILGSPAKVYELLTAAAKAHPVAGNAEGSYLTMRSHDGAIFFVINIIGNFGTVFLDNGYYNKAIAASPVHALPGYVFGGLAWFAVPFLCATTGGLAALALEGNPAFPTYPLRMSSADVSAGLVLPNAAIALLGKGGGVAVLLLVFMAVTSAMSAELIAVSSIFTYDVYATYINPMASGTRLIWTSHVVCAVYAVLLSAFSTGLYYAGISMGFLYLMMGVIISSAVLPAALTLLSTRQTRLAATLSPILGLACSLTGWLATAKSQFGSVTIDSAGSNIPMLVGNVVALLSPVVFTPLLTYISGGPDAYDWSSMRAIRKADDTDVLAKQGDDVSTYIPASSITTAQTIEQEHAETIKLQRSAKIARYLTLFLTIALLILWPMPMYGSGYVFSEKFFTGWIVVGMLWLFVSVGIVGIYPVFEGRGTIWRVCRALVGRGVVSRQRGVATTTTAAARSPESLSVVEGEEVIVVGGQEKERMSTRTFRKEKL